MVLDLGNGKLEETIILSAFEKPNTMFARN